jgi:aryl-alcohol dehydrogenase-like predicted oxidoreductase
METRRLGSTGHTSTVITFGAYAIGNLDQSQSDRTIEYVLERGVNHIDVAPSYAEAELRLGDWLKRNPSSRNIFIGCKTEQRDKAGAREELLRSLDRFGRDSHDLFQLHAVCTPEHLEACFAPGGSMEAILEARDEGLVKHIGITGHGWQSPATHQAALDRFPFATVMTSGNRMMAARPDYARDWNALLARCQRDDVGVHVLKATAKGPWGDRTPTHNTWYEPLTDPVDVRHAVAWLLAQPVTTLCTAGDAGLLPDLIDAAEAWRSADPAAADILLEDPGYTNFFDAA